MSRRNASIHGGALSSAHSDPPRTRVQPTDSPQHPVPTIQTLYLRVIFAQLTLLVCTLALQHAAALVPRPSGRFTEDIFYMRALLRFYVVLCGSLAMAWLLQPVVDTWLDSLRARLTTRRRQVLVAASVILTCVGMSWFLVHFGRRQFGSWDYGILIDAGYRGLIGQRAFIDFVTPTPPLFNWTSTLAFRLFGLKWDATLLFAALFSSGTLVWSFFLLRAFGLRAFAALATATTLEAAAMLSCCFWWYNNSTLILAALLYLACLVLARRPRSRVAEISFVLLLGVLPLTKPNIAGLTIAGCLLVLLVVSTQWRPLLLLIAAGVGLAALLFPVLGISLSGMLATYRSVAKERGGLSTFGFEALSIGERQMTVVWLIALCLPLLALVPRLRADLRHHRWRNAAFWLFFPLAAVIAVCGVAGNGEFRDVECTLLVVALAVLAFGREKNHPRLHKLTVALLCGMLAADLYAGIARLRVYTIRPHIFFEWTDNNHHLDTGFLRGMTVSETFVEADAQIRQAVRSESGPVFFGPRLDFEYAALGLPSPTHWVTFFQPGTAFGRDQTPQLLKGWEEHRFVTLIFLKGDYIFYPEALRQFIRAHYVRDDAYPRITVWHRRPAT